MLPRSVIELYKWSEGLQPSAGIGTDFFPGFGMDSLPEMIATYQELSNATDFPRFGDGDKQWFPILRSGSTDFYGVCCANKPVPDGEVMDDDNELGAVVGFVSVEAMLRTLLRSYETGVYFVNEKGYLGVSRARFKEVARQFNPGVKRWEE
jgi:hypothetical protein